MGSREYQDRARGGGATKVVQMHKLVDFSMFCFIVLFFGVTDWVRIVIKANDTRVLHTTSFATSPTPTSTPASTPATTPADAIGGTYSDGQNDGASSDDTLADRFVHVSWLCTDISYVCSFSGLQLGCFKMRSRISIRWSVRPSVGP